MKAREPGCPRRRRSSALRPGGLKWAPKIFFQYRGVLGSAFSGPVSLPDLKSLCKDAEVNWADAGVRCV